jgi:hypothetical protein
MRARLQRTYQDADTDNTLTEITNTLFIRFQGTATLDLRHAVEAGRSAFYLACALLLLSVERQTLLLVSEVVIVQPADLLVVWRLAVDLLLVEGG